MGRRTVYLVIFCTAALAAGFLLWRDLTLPERARESAQTQVLVESLDLQREISGDLFTLHAAEARRMQDERIEASSMDIVANLAGEGRWELEAASGSLEPGGQMRLHDVLARNLRKGTPLDITVKEAFWNPERRIWELQGGVLLRQEPLQAGGETGVAEPGGRVTLYGGAWATWEKR